MRKKLYEIMIAFVVVWILGQVFQSPYRDNLTLSIVSALTYALYNGLYKDLLKKSSYINFFKEASK